MSNNACTQQAVVTLKTPSCATQDSLGGNAKTFILGNVSSAPAAVKETVSTLRFLQSAKRIRNAVRSCRCDWHWCIVCRQSFMKQTLKTE